jgi:hypothetical protein
MRSTSGAQRLGKGCWMPPGAHVQPRRPTMNAALKLTVPTRPRVLFVGHDEQHPADRGNPICVTSPGTGSRLTRPARSPADPGGRSDETLVAMPRPGRRAAAQRQGAAHRRSGDQPGRRSRRCPAPRPPLRGVGPR